MTNDDTDKTEEVRKQLAESGAVGSEIDSDSGAVLTLDGDDSPRNGGGEDEEDECGDDGGN